MIQFLLNRNKKEMLKIGFIILSLIIILFSPQAVWMQNNIYNEWLTVFDRLWFRLPVTIIVSILFGLFYISFWVRFIHKRLGLAEEKIISKLAAAHIPFLFTGLMPFRFEFLYVDFFNSLIFSGAIISYLILLEYFFLIRITCLNFKKKLKSSWAVPLFFSLTLLFYAPLQIYLTNPMEFYFSIYQIIINTLIVYAIVYLILLQIFLIFPYNSKSYKVFTAIIFAVSLALWIQGNILGWKYGVLDGSSIEWGKKFAYGIIDSSIWLILIIISVLLLSHYDKLLKNASLFFILLQAVVYTLFIFQQIPKEAHIKEPSFRRYTVDETGKFDYSSETNVIILVVDEYQSDIFQEIIKEKTEYEDVFDGFTYFPNALAGFTFTELAVPSILLGKLYDNTIPIERFIEQTYMSNSILKSLKENGYEVDVYPQDKNTVYYDDKIISNIRKRGQIIEGIKELSYLYDVSLFYYMPHFIKPFIYNNSRWFLFAGLNNIVFKKYLPGRKATYAFNGYQILKDNNIRFITDFWSQAEVKYLKNGSKSKIPFKFYHINGIHVRLSLNEDFVIKDMIYSHKAYISTAKANMRIIRWFLEGLKQLGVYDNSLIFIMGDHGSGRSEEMYIRPVEDFSRLTNFTYNVYNFNYCKSRGIPLYLVKPISARGKLKTSHFPITVLDTPETIVSELGISADFPGIDVLKSTNSMKRVRYFRAYDYEKRAGDHFLGTITEYSVEGDSWDTSSWKKNRTFEPHNH